MVSIISMPVAVVASSFPESLNCTRAMLIRFSDMTREMMILTNSVVSPKTVRRGLWRSMRIR